jgi:hypothetical protein
MKLYLFSDYWEPWYDKAFGFVVAARDEEQARKLASEQSGGEGADAWLDKKASTCKEVKPSKAEVIIRDFASA